MDDDHLDTDVKPRLVAKKRRQRAYDEGVYELSEREGFTCPTCGWQGLTAPLNDVPAEAMLADAPAFVCPDCGDGVKDYSPDGEYLAPFTPDCDNEK